MMLLWAQPFVVLLVQSYTMFGLKYKGMTSAMIAPNTPPKNYRSTSPSSSSSLGAFATLLEDIMKVKVKKEQNSAFRDTVFPVSNIVVIPAEPEIIINNENLFVDDSCILNDIEIDIEQQLTNDETFRIINWDGKGFYSDYIKAGIEYKKQKSLQNDPLGVEPAQQEQKNPTNVVMLFESPSSSTSESSFYNGEKFRFHDWPAPKSTKGKAILGPNRHAGLNGASYPVFLRDGAPPEGLLEHWAATIPGFVSPTFVSNIDAEKDTVYAYLPVEQVKHHVNDPETHYHLVGKDSIHLVTERTTKLLQDTRTKRPCVVKTTHSMGSKGIFVIRNDQDEQEFEKFLMESGNPSYVIVDFVDIARNVACHFFMHPDGSVTWFGSNENHREDKTRTDGKFSSDSYLILDHQEELKELQAPFVKEVVQYCRNLGFWGFCGIDVLFDSSGTGYLVDINPRVTGSCPALMTLQQLHKEYGFDVGLFRPSGNINYYGSSTQLLEEVKEYNDANIGKSCVVVHSMYEPDFAIGKRTRVNIGVYSNNLDKCKEALNRFAQPTKTVKKKTTKKKQNKKQTNQQSKA